MMRRTSLPVAVGAAAWDGGDLIGANMNLAVSGLLLSLTSDYQQLRSPSVYAAAIVWD